MAPDQDALLQVWKPELFHHPDGFDRAKEFVSNNFLPEGIKNAKVPSLDSIPAIASGVEDLICENLISSINDTRKTINDVIRGPLKMISKMESKYYQILRDVDSMESSLIGLLKSVDGPNLNIADLYNAYNNLANSCVFESTLGNMTGILEAFEDIKNLADMTTPEFKNQLIDDLIGMIKEDLLGVANQSAGKILDDLIQDNVGSFAQLRQKYNDMLKASGVYKLLDLLYELEMCLAESCRAYKNLKRESLNTYDRYKEQLGISDDPDTPSDPLNMEKMKKRFGDQWDVVKGKASNLNRHTEDALSGINKIRNNPKEVVIEGLDEFFNLQV